MLIRLNGKQSVYLELADEYKRLIRAGALKDGEKLPSVRALALELGINPNTVERAYCKLEEEGLVRSMEKKGVFVCAENVHASVINEAARQLRILKRAGLAYDELCNLAAEVYREDMQ